MAVGANLTSAGELDHSDQFSGIRGEYRKGLLFQSEHTGGELI